MASENEPESNDIQTTVTNQMSDAKNYLTKKEEGDVGNDAEKDLKNPKEEYETSFVTKEVPTPSLLSIKIGHRRIHRDGGTSYKRINTSQIMESIQLGIERSVGTLSSQPERDVLMVDFMTVESTPFLLEKSKTLSDRNQEFIFKTYAPVAFRHLRDLFGIMPDSFVASFCQAPLLELANAGASGSLFYLTQNDDFIIKTVQFREAEFLQKLLPGYFLNLSQNPYTLLPKFFGLYCYKRNTRNVRLVVMNNVLPSDIKIHQKYDLKGSKYMRKASKTELQSISPTYKDLDFIEHHPNGIFLRTDDCKNLLKTVHRDCMVLESFRIMDYSLLLGIHYVEQAKEETSICSKITEENLVRENINNSPSGEDGNFTPSEAVNGISEEKIKNINSDVFCSCVTETSIQSKARKREGRNKQINITLNGIPAQTAHGEKLLLFVGIIDILQSYSFKKKVEHLWKSIVHEGDDVSVHNPAFYARRFEEFLAQRVFKVSTSSPKSKHNNAPLIK